MAKLTSSASEPDVLDLGLATEIIPGRLYFASMGNHPHSTERRRYFTIDFDLIYEPYFADFGPLNIAMLVQFLRAMEQQVGADLIKEVAARQGSSETLREQKRVGKMSTTSDLSGVSYASVSPPTTGLPPPSQPAEIIFYTSHNGHQRANAGYLIAAFCVLSLGMTPSKAWALFREVYPPFLPFRDASFGVSTFNLTIFDCLCALHKAKALHWIDVESFDVAAYERNEAVDNGDWNWIVPGKLIAFSSPVDVIPQRHSSICAKAFRAAGVHLVIRLCSEKLYDRKIFIERGMRHMEMPFEDGSTPTDSMVTLLMETVAKQYGAVAVHCKAGLGRTGTMISLYVMKNFGFTAKEAIAWARIMRPGSVIGPQQHYLEMMERRVARAGDVARSKSATGAVSLPFMSPTEAWQAKQEAERCLFDEGRQAAREKESRFKYASSKKLAAAPPSSPSAILLDNGNLSRCSTAATSERTRSGQRTPSAGLRPTFTNSQLCSLNSARPSSVPLRAVGTPAEVIPELVVAPSGGVRRPPSPPALNFTLSATPTLE